MTGESEGLDQDSEHISKTLKTLLFEHLEPGVPVDPTPNSFVGAENREDIRNAKLAEGLPDVSAEVADPSDETPVTVDQLNDNDRMRLRMLRLNEATLTDPVLVNLADKLKTVLDDPDQIARIENLAWRNLSQPKYDRVDFNEAVNIILDRLRAEREGLEPEVK